MAQDNILITIDSSSSCSGLAVFKNGKLEDFTEIVHKCKPKLEAEIQDIWQPLLSTIISKVLIKYCFKENEEDVPNLDIVIEVPRGAYANNDSYGRMMLYAGIWLGNLQNIIISIPSLLNKTKLHYMYGGVIAKYFNFGVCSSKKDAVTKVQELYKIDLSDYKLPKYNQDGTFTRVKKSNDIRYNVGPKHNAADAILLGHIFLKKQKLSK